jgi:hypothetical protein
MPRTQPRDLAVQPLRLLRGLHPDDGARCARQRIWRQARFDICHRHGSDFAAVFGEPTGQATADEIPSLDNDERTRQHADLTPHVWIDTPRSERSENVRSLQPDPLFSEWSLLSRGSPKRGEGPQLPLICATPITIHCFTCDQPTMRSWPGYCPIDLVPRLAEGASNRTSVRRAASPSSRAACRSRVRSRDRAGDRTAGASCPLGSNSARRTHPRFRGRTGNRRHSRGPS